MRVHNPRAVWARVPAQPDVLATLPAAAAACLPADPVYTAVGVFKSDRVTIKDLKILGDRGIRNTDGGLDRPG